MKGKAIDSEGSAFATTAKGKGKETDRVVIFEKGPLEGLVRFEFKALGEFDSLEGERKAMVCEVTC